MTLERIFGLGPETITFGPSTEIIETVLGENALYKFKSVSPSQAPLILKIIPYRLMGIEMEHIMTYQ